MEKIFFGAIKYLRNSFISIKSKQIMQYITSLSNNSLLNS